MLESLASGQLEARVDVPTVVTERRGWRPRKDVEAIAFIHAVRIGVEKIPAANRQLECAHRRKADFRIDETLATIVLYIASAVAVKGRRVFPVVGVAGHAIPGATCIRAGNRPAPRRSFLG